MFSRFSLFHQLFSAMALISLGISLTLWLLFTRATQKIILEEIESRAQVTASDLARVSRVGVETQNKFKTLDAPLNAAASQNDVAFVHVLNLKNKILASSLYPEGGYASQASGGETYLEIKKPVVSDTLPLNTVNKKIKIKNKTLYQIGLVHLAFSLNTYHAQMKEVRYQALMLASTLFFLALIISFYFARALSQKIKKISMAVADIGRGNYHARLESQSNDELGDLALGFNLMAEELERLIYALKEHNQKLEVKVSQRTEHLEQALEEIKQTQNKLIHSEKFALVGQLASGIAHDLNNPITGILVTTQLAQDNAPKNATDLRNDLSEIETLAQRCKHAIRNLVDFSKTHPLAISSVSLHQTTARTLELMAHQAELNQIKIKNNVDPALPSIWVSAFELQQALSNLVLNAIQAMPHGGSLTINSSAEEKNIVLEIGDTGNGIEPAHLKSLFGNTSADQESQGATGAGLLVTRRIIDHLGGKLWARSDGKGKGSAFYLSLPIHAQEYNSEG